jgi:LmbE family N-acetylglucosaminyl deacetylase
MASHFDDEVFGAGGYLARFGDEVAVAVVCVPGTRGEYDPERHARSLQATRTIAGATRVTYLGTEPMLGREPVARSHMEEYLELGRALDVCLAAGSLWKPKRVIVPWRGDMHQDHRTLAEAAMIAFRTSRNATDELWAMEIPSSSDRGPEPIGHEGAYLPINMGAKAGLVRLYEHESAPDRTLNVVQAQAVSRGAQCGEPTAEFYRVLSAVLR